MTDGETTFNVWTYVEDGVTLATLGIDAEIENVAPVAIYG